MANFGGFQLVPAAIDQNALVLAEIGSKPGLEAVTDSIMVETNPERSKYFDFGRNFKLWIGCSRVLGEDEP